MRVARTNPNTYARPGRRTYKLEVEFCLDMVPGAWHVPQDLMKWIAQHSYVKEVTFDATQMED